MIELNVVDGVHRVAHAYVNCYVIEDDSGVTLVDAGLPTMSDMVVETLERVGRRPDEVRALLLTHAHFDHVGFAKRVRRDLDVPVHVHDADRRLARHPYLYRPQRNRFFYVLRHPRSWPLLGRMTAAGALNVRGTNEVVPLTTGEPLAVPGGPIAVHTPGHTDGHCILHLADRSTVLSGDALVTLDPYTAQTGPQIVAVAATRSARQALASLAAVGETGADVLLPGHGRPWFDGAERAVEQALRRGAH